MKDKIEQIIDNLSAWLEKTVPKSNLDSNFKKNTAFIKKCRTSLNSDNRASLLKDISTLSLEKYVSEVVSAISEGILKCKVSTNISAAVDVVSALHQRFPDSFTPELFDSLRKMLMVSNTKPTAGNVGPQSLAEKEKEDLSKLLKQRTVLKVATEIWLSGVFWGIENGINKFPEAKDVLKGIIEKFKNLDPENSFNDKNFFIEGPISGTWNPLLKNNHLGLIFHSLKGFLSIDRDKFTSAPIAVSFLKSYGYNILRIKPQRRTPEKGDVATEEHNEADLNNSYTFVTPSILTNEQVENIQELFFSYAKDLSNNLVRDHKNVKHQEKVNNERSIARGEINEDAKARYESNYKAYEKHLQYMETITEFLDINMPELPNDSNKSIIGGVVVNEFGFSRGDGENIYEGGPWEDEDARTFYEKILDLKALVPGILLGLDSTGNSEEKQNLEEEKTETNPVIQNDNDNDNDEKLSIHSNDEKIEEDPNLTLELEDDNAEDHGDEKTTASAQMTAFLVGLQNMGNRDLIDQAAVDFCYINNKASRKRLIRNLIEVPQKRLDLLSYYSRFIATLSPYFTDIGRSVEAGLEKEFKFLLRVKTSKTGDSSLLERRIKNVRYLAELTKFKIVPYHFAFYVIKSLLDTFIKPGNIETLSNFLEVCGRYLLKSAETSERTAALLDIMVKKKTSMHLNERLEMMIENAFYHCNPPSQTASVKKELTPMQLFIRRLFLVEISRFPNEKMTKIVRRLHFEDDDIYNFLLKTVTKVHKNKFSHIYLVAALLSSLSKYQPEFVNDVVDQLLEDIKIGLEENNYKFNQKRISQVKLLSELFIYHVINSTIIFNTLVEIISFGYQNGKPAKGAINPFDPPNDYFRIRLCCTVLDSCGTYFNNAYLSGKMNEFLTFFQLYILTKENIPMDIQFAIGDTFETVNPNLILFNTYEEADAALNLIIQNRAKDAKVSPDMPKKEVNLDIEEDLESSSDDEHSDISENFKDEDDIDIEEEYLENLTDEEEKVVLLNQLQREEDEAIRRKEDEEFEKELQLMMASTSESRKLERKVAPLDVPIPMRLLDKNKQAEIEETGENIAFSLLTKRGNKQQVRTVAVPADNTLAVQTLNKQKAERIEQQQLKEIVLGYEEAQDQEASRDFDKSLRARGISVSHVKPKQKSAQHTVKSSSEAHTEVSSKAKGGAQRFEAFPTLEATQAGPNAKNTRNGASQTFNLADFLQKNSSNRGGRGRS